MAQVFLKSLYQRHVYEGLVLILWVVSHKAIYGQPVPGNLQHVQEEKAFQFECSNFSFVDGKTMF